MLRIAGSFYILLYYLPIYFQAVKGTNATESGIRTIPLILGLSESCFVSQSPLHSAIEFKKSDLVNNV